mmetsp:Transcript_5676/g.21406  ORF Transcript_5676/g.21406 Transcript_5676/m.21406 type:complete len:302 (-) Transcript_5676:104-1009(-)|eukprot:CAMPEP_0117446880 /NCGR_PEP_ID=MMETSP0759-20121206/6578_1 /TAXON_ID=63605 /ORGANISM="Percolomonas cosmopolitus, Strain WS" /LENGTH=301 /DNA_ID=CAMNT_0005239179 /DNA_START=140 /DNA_END=1045 /DNA_ORIENTATION=+
MKRIVRQLSIQHINKTGRRTPLASLSRFYSEKQEQQAVEQQQVNDVAVEDTADAAEEVEIVQEDSTNEQPEYITLTKNAEFFPEQYMHKRQFKGYIQPEHYKKSEGQLLHEFTIELEKIAAPVFGIEPPVSDLEMGTNKLKFQILKQAVAHFGREIPLSDIARMRSVKDVAHFFVAQVQAEIPPPEFHVPQNVSLFIKEHAQKREILVRKHMIKLIGERKRKAVERQFKKYFPGPTPNLTDDEVSFYLRVFRRNADDQIFKKKLYKKFNPRKLHDTRISYERKFTEETERVFSSKSAEQQV